MNKYILAELKKLHKQKFFTALFWLPILLAAFIGAAKTFNQDSGFYVEQGSLAYMGEFLLAAFTSIGLVTSVFATSLLTDADSKNDIDHYLRLRLSCPQVILSKITAVSIILLIQAVISYFLGLAEGCIAWKGAFSPLELFSLPRMLLVCLLTNLIFMLITFLLQQLVPRTWLGVLAAYIIVSVRRPAFLQTLLGQHLRADLLCGGFPDAISDPQFIANAPGWGLGFPLALLLMAAYLAALFLLCLFALRRRYQK